jgi:SAM-dependent methyltransferase
MLKISNLPAPLKKNLRQIANIILDTYDGIMGRRDELTPPRSLWRIGSGDYKHIGNTWLRYFVDFAELQPNHNVLDVGCGVGRMAVPLTTYLNTSSRYEGFDIDSNPIKWCQDHISSRYPNFNFRVANIYNKFYKPDGVAAENYHFPYDDHSFDFVFLTSVFTHMLPQGVEQYMSEITRILTPGGRCLISYFLLNEESINLIKQNPKRPNFLYGTDPYRTTDSVYPEVLIAYQEDYIRGLYKKHSLSIREPIIYGSWSGRPNYTDYQDIIVAYKN